MTEHKKKEMKSKKQSISACVPHNILPVVGTWKRTREKSAKEAVVVLTEGMCDSYVISC